MLGQCFANVAEDGPTFPQHWVNVLCFLGDFVVAMTMLGPYVRVS